MKKRQQVQNLKIMCKICNKMLPTETIGEHSKLCSLRMGKRDQRQEINQTLLELNDDIACMLAGINAIKSTPKGAKKRSLNMLPMQSPIISMAQRKPLGSMGGVGGDGKPKNMAGKFGGILGSKTPQMSSSSEFQKKK